MHTRREFVKRAAFLSGSAGMWGALSEVVREAAAIEPRRGSAYLDAEHVVILMQENRSFDHCFGKLRGVRGFNDPRAITLPDKNPVWAQTDPDGQTFVPFRLNIKDTKATWMGSLPHSWTDQVDARNHGRYDRWLQAKRSGHREYAKMPLTLGYYDREDIPFYYALADAFTVCDQHFCSSLTGTTPNRLYLWTGTIRERPNADAPANVLNSDVTYDRWAHWTTFPERLEDLGVSWKIYQNELSVDSGLNGEADAWLANFTDNPIEWFAQYRVGFAASRREYVKERIAALPAEIAALKEQARGSDGAAGSTARLDKQIAEKTARFEAMQKEQEIFNDATWEKLSQREKNLHLKAFCTNRGDPAYRELEELAYNDNGTERRVQVPKGDVLHQFRQDVREGKLPAVSWLVAPERFSDHPGSAWYGAWYLAETLAILIDNPDVWQKTIFILTYDENDGYFDHVPPFVAPHPRRPETGRASREIDTAVEYVEREQELKRKSPEDARDSAIGLGYRVPLIVASPWSRGGCVCSQVFDHTSPLQFLEQWLTHKLGTPVREPNISQWRRAVCGDLTSIFQSTADEKGSTLPYPKRDAFIEQIHRARFKGLPSGYQALRTEEIEQLRRGPSAAEVMPHQEVGVRRSCPLPYELMVEGRLSADRTKFEISFEARNQAFGPRAAGSPFIVYAYGGPEGVAVRNYAVSPGGRIEDAWSLNEFAGGRYHLRAYGPNGFFREFIGGADDPRLDIHLEYGRIPTSATPLSGNVDVVLVNKDPRAGSTVAVSDLSYKTGAQRRELAPHDQAGITVETQRSFGWYDVSIKVAGHAQFERRYAGHVETGQWSFSDPVIGRRVV